MSLPSALAGLRVIDLSDASGAYCGKLFADMGADVILIEPPAGSELRRQGPFWSNRSTTEQSLMFAHDNTNKRSVVLDLDNSTARRQLRELMGSSDLVIETFPPGHLADRNLDYADVRKSNRDLVWISITPFGRSGPYRNFHGSELVCQALGGMTGLNGNPNEPPLRGPGPQAFHCAGLQAAIAALARLLGADVGTSDRFIDVSIQECVAASVEHVTTLFRREGVVAQRQGSLHWSRDFRVARAADGHLMLSSLGDWTTWSEWVSELDPGTDLKHPRWRSPDYRRAHANELFDRLEAWTSKQRVDELVAAAQLRRLPVAAVRPLRHLVGDPQLLARQFFVPVFHDDLGSALRYPGAPYRFSRSPWRIVHRPPLLGEHSRELLNATAGQPPRAESNPRAGIASNGLKGLRIVDLTWNVAGPVATRWLADFGAEVIKIEHPKSAPAGQRQRSRLGGLNRGKQSVAIDLDHAAGRELLRRLVAVADVVIDNFSPRVMSNWGFDYTQLNRICPEIICVKMSAYGLDGPLRDAVAFGPNLQAAAGFNSLMHDSSGTPVGWGFAYSDMLAGWSGAFAVLLALRHRQATGEGQLVDLSQFENLVSLHGAEIMVALNPPAQTEEAPGCRSPSDHPSLRNDGFSGVFRCLGENDDDPAADRWCAIDIRDEADWRRLCEALGHPEWTGDQRFASVASRARHRVALAKNVEAWTRQRNPTDVMNTLQRAAVPAGVVATAVDLCGRDPQLEWRRNQGQRPPCALEPTIGEHTDDVLKRLLDVSDDELGAWRAAAVIA
ncbi:MAG: CoA transferase [Deltaproteobacteria bacterium]|nr:CoA transferase [Deltaproteobacteria bacterium]